MLSVRSGRWTISDGFERTNNPGSVSFNRIRVGPAPYCSTEEEDHFAAFPWPAGAASEEAAGAQPAVDEAQLAV